jgi:transposase IS116/IS110/IS902 family protein
VPGIGPITATALSATVVDPTSFKSGREFAAWIGVVLPKGAPHAVAHDPGADCRATP